jgi:ketosteroid isomerase-like protein
MSQANVESTERLTDAYNRRDVDALAELVTEDFEFITTNVGLVEGGSFRGRAGLEAYFADVGNTWEEYRISAWEPCDLGESVFGALRLEARGKGSGVPLTTRMWSVNDFRDGKCWRSRVFLDHGEALRAAGLTE